MFSGEDADAGEITTDAGDVGVNLVLVGVEMSFGEMARDLANSVIRAMPAPILLRVGVVGAEWVLDRVSSPPSLSRSSVFFRFGVVGCSGRLSRLDDVVERFLE